MRIRKYRPGEEAELWKLFHDTIRNVNIRDYTLEQVRAWAPDAYDQKRWRARVEEFNPFVCCVGDAIVGYAGWKQAGYIDHFYVHHQWQRKGVGRRLLQAIEVETREARLVELTADVSITAKPFFESHGFTVLTFQEVALGTVVLKNFKMLRRLV
jgi:putative acetyltransferase